MNASKEQPSHRAGNYNIYEHGISVKYLSAFDECRQKVQLLGEGWRPTQRKFALTYGIIAHAALEYWFKALQAGELLEAPTQEMVRKQLADMEDDWRKENSRATAESIEDMEMSMLFCEAVLPMYFEHWWKHMVKWKWLSIEGEFSIPYELSDGRGSHLFGYQDGAYEYKRGLWLLETKNKSRVNMEALHDQLPRDLQLGVYLWALYQETGKVPKGAHYNILRRPMLRRKKNETVEQFAQRCADDVEERPDFYFISVEIPTDKTMLHEFESEQLRPRVEEFYRWWKGEGGHYRNPNACEAKYGMCDFNQLCAGNTVGYECKPRPPVSDPVEMLGEGVT